MARPIPTFFGPYEAGGGAAPAEPEIPANTQYLLVFVFEGLGAGVTVGEASATFLDEASGVTNGAIAAYGLASPPTGVQLVSVVTPAYNSNILVVALTDVNLSAPGPILDIGAGSQGGGGPFSITLDPGEVDNLIVGAAWMYGPFAPHEPVGDADAFVVNAELTDGGSGNDVVAGVAVEDGVSWGTHQPGNTTYTDIIAIAIAGTAGSPPSNTPPDTPTVTAGTPEATSCPLTSSAFADDDADGHAGSQWQVTLAADTGFADPDFDSGDDDTNLTSISATGLTPETSYICRVRHKDDSGDGATEWSEWSATDSFTTAAAAITAGKVAGAIIGFGEF